MSRLLRGMATSTVAGRVAVYSKEKGYGLVRRMDTGEVLFAHYSAVQMPGFKYLFQGENVNLTIDTKPNSGKSTVIEIAAPTGDAFDAKRESPKKLFFENTVPIGADDDHPAWGQALTGSLAERAQAMEEIKTLHQQIKDASAMEMMQMVSEYYKIKGRKTEGERRRLLQQYEKRDEVRRTFKTNDELDAMEDVNEANRIYLQQKRDEFDMYGYHEGAALIQKQLDEMDRIDSSDASLKEQFTQ